MKLRRVLAVALKEWREITRDRVYLLLAFLLPVVLMLVFGYGMNQDVENVALLVMDEDRTPMSRDYLQHFAGSRYFRLVGQVSDARSVDPRLANARARILVRVGPRFQESLVAGRPAAVQVVIDGSFTTTARTLRGYVEAINRAANTALQTRYLAHRLGLTHARALELVEPIRLETRYLYNQEVRSIWSIAPGLIMFILMLAPPLLMALSVVRERETGALYNIQSSAIGRGEFLAGKLLPNLGISFINALVLWILAVYYFGAPFKGSYAAFLAATALYLLGTSALGLLISLAVRTQQAAITVAIVVAVIVSLQFSGIFTPVSSMQGMNYFLAQLFPGKYYLDAMHATFLKGLGLDSLGAELAFFAAFALVLLALCHRLFRKRTRT